MHVLATKQAMIQYINSFDVPHILIDEAHPSVYFNVEQNKWKWRKQDLMALSVKKIQAVCEYLEEFYNVANSHMQQPISKTGFNR